MAGVSLNCFFWTSTHDIQFRSKHIHVLVWSSQRPDLNPNGNLCTDGLHSIWLSFNYIIKIYIHKSKLLDVQNPLKSMYCFHSTQLEHQHNLCKASSYLVCKLPQLVPLFGRFQSIIGEPKMKPSKLGHGTAVSTLWDCGCWFSVSSADPWRPEAGMVTSLLLQPSHIRTLSFQGCGVGTSWIKVFEGQPDPPYDICGRRPEAMRSCFIHQRLHWWCWWCRPQRPWCSACNITW